MKFYIFLLSINLVFCYKNLQPSLFDYNVTMNVDDPVVNEKRYFLLNLPKNRNQNNLSAVISIHGYGDNAIGMRISDGFGKTLTEQNVVVAYA